MEIKRQTGYPTSDGELFDVKADAVKHQSGLDLKSACEDDVEIENQPLINFMKANKEVVLNFIRYNLTEKKPAEKKVSPKKKAGLNKKPVLKEDKPADKDKS